MCLESPLGRGLSLQQDTLQRLETFPSKTTSEVLGQEMMPQIQTRALRRYGSGAWNTCSWPSQRATADNLMTREASKEGTQHKDFIRVYVAASDMRNHRPKENCFMPGFDEEWRYLTEVQYSQMLINWGRRTVRHIFLHFFWLLNALLFSQVPLEGMSPRKQRVTFVGSMVLRKRCSSSHGMPWGTGIPVSITFLRRKRNRGYTPDGRKGKSALETI